MAEYAVEDEVAAFFKKTTTSRSACEHKARALTNSDNVVQIPIQGACSYSMYAGANLEYVVQCRLKSLPLRTEMCELATKTYGPLVPTVQFHGEMGDSEGDGREPLLVYHMTRMAGVTQLDFVLSHGVPQRAPEFFPFRQNLFGDIASFFAQSWLSPQPTSPEYTASLKATYQRDLQSLHGRLLERFRPFIKTCIESLDDILSLPMVLLHKDFGVCNLLVDPSDCHLTGVVDWAEAVIGPFGTNLHSIQAFAGAMHLKNGWLRFPDYDKLEVTFWTQFTREVGGLSEEMMGTIKKARLLGFLLSHGFTSRLGASAPVPLRDDEHGRYHMMFLDGYLISEGTRMDGID